jgi:hypothetical protein
MSNYNEQSIDNSHTENSMIEKEVCKKQSILTQDIFDKINDKLDMSDRLKLAMANKQFNEYHIFYCKNLFETITINDIYLLNNYNTKFPNARFIIYISGLLEHLHFISLFNTNKEIGKRIIKIYCNNLDLTEEELIKLPEIESMIDMNELEILINDLNSKPSIKKITDYNKNNPVSSKMINNYLLPDLLIYEKDDNIVALDDGYHNVRYIYGRPLLSTENTVPIYSIYQLINKCSMCCSCGYGEHKSKRFNEERNTHNEEYREKIELYRIFIRISFIKIFICLDQLEHISINHFEYLENYLKYYTINTPNIISLQINNTNIFDSLDIMSLTKLKILNLSNINNNNFLAISELSELEEIYFYHTSDINIELFKKLNNLKVLHIETNNINNLEEIGFLSNIRDIKLISYNIYFDENFEGFKYLSNLSLLRIENIRIYNLDNFENLINLNKLSLPTCNISSLSNIDNLINLSELILFENTISNIERLQSLTNLTILDLEENYAHDINPLSNLVNLTHLNLHRNSIHNISPLKNLVNLTELDLSLNHIKNINPLSDMIMLKKLNLNYNKIKNIESLSKLSNLDNLQELYFSNNKIKNINILSQFKSITMLNISFNEITNIIPILSLKKLTEITLGNEYIDYNINIFDIIDRLDILSNLTQLYIFRRYQSEKLDIHTLCRKFKISYFDW